MNRLPMNLQFFADPPADPPANPPAEPTVQNQQPQFDYEKLAGIISGKQSVAEDTVLKNYFKQQGLSKEEMDQAIGAFKTQKAANQPDVAKMQSDMQTAQNIAMQAQMENRALLMHDELGIDLKAISYVMKLADLSGVAENGAINDEALKAALNKVLEDLPQLKKQEGQINQGFRQVGAASNTQGQQSQPEVPKVATKRWNRFNN